ncbi:enoyl-CoA hydratase/isomerase family protein [Nocardioides sp. Bht2]|uniref:enoyl-CoA hydratase/isomerase family protein n=1 Tax=Nocardioides sp. Bht2 TaxID=3392297 RepID=UPI0039B6909E
METRAYPEAGLSVTVDGAVATLILDRPEAKNAQHPALWAAMTEALDSFDEQIRVVVVRGAGGTFSAGLDLSLLDPARAGEEGSMVSLAGQGAQAIIDQIDVYQQPFAKLADPRFISIAVVEGFAIGAGFQLALCCDLRIVADDARFCMKEPALGLVPDLVGTKPLVEAVGYARALEICATARWVNGEEAGRIGLAQVVAPATELDAELAKLVGSLTQHPAAAVRATTQLLQMAGQQTLTEQRLAERTAQADRFREIAAALT